MDDERRDFMEKLGAQVDVWKTRVSQLENRAHSAEPADRRKLEKRIADLKIKVREFETQRDELQKANREAWNEIKDSLKEAWHEINTLFNSMING